MVMQIELVVVGLKPSFVRDMSNIICAKPFQVTSSRSLGSQSPATHEEGVFES